MTVFEPGPEGWPLLLDSPAARPCVHPRAHHQHGTYGRYNGDGCRCSACVDAASAMRRNRTRQIAYGRWQAWSDAEPVREHVKTLLIHGLSYATISRRSGLHKGTVRNLVIGTRAHDPPRRVRHHTATALLAVTLDRPGLGAERGLYQLEDTPHAVVPRG